MAPKREASGDEHEKGGGLKCRGDQLRAASPADSAPLQEKKHADHADGNLRFVSSEHREKIAAVFGDDDRDRRGRAARRQPVAPSDDEAGVFADGAAREIVLSAATRNRGAKLRERGSRSEERR